ncbi:RagB/SusD family nutrient uptake outer membrane protein [Terrimonas pollutisoli]|uniref:RagB/SusD family nutrient uptake outer membrane protein n=1 Tax=Terrimonas pollutisoli TaxID=3034147 RepID=UPI0023ED411F|nr:RagB/SusD family nutrient uptake outer membrane protein [Terrimonas sp. H1YJ31]
MKYNFITLIMLLTILSFVSCQKFLESKPKGTLTESDLNTPEAIDGLLTAAYAAIGNDDREDPISSMWAYGSVHSDDAYKGGGAVNNRTEYDALEQYYTIEAAQIPNNAGFPATWTNLYRAISRANFALKKLNSVSEADFPQKKTRQGEARFLRGHLNFLLKILFKYFSYIDEETSDDDILKISNRTFSNDELWNIIADDFQFAVDNLPVSQSQPGRVNRLSAEAYLAKVRLYQAYEQNENHEVININKNKLEEVVALTSDVINSGKYKLSNDFAENFLWDYDNGPESIFAIQYSINDGTTNGRLSMSTSLNYSNAPQYGCCWFHIPSQNMVNAFKTDQDGLPMFNTFNDADLKDADLVSAGATVDPRIDHTIGIQGHPFKYNPKILYSHSWERIPQIYGSFGNMKEQQAADCPCFKKVGPYIGSSKNVDVIRFADLLLWKAEALIELGRQEEARPLINQIRVRAKNSTGRTKFLDGSSPSNYRIAEYDGINLTWTQANARMALQWERRLEFAMESPRFFDLVRWGIAAETLNAYLAVEKTKRDYLKKAFFTKGKNEYFPIPQKEIDFTKGLYVQNTGY